MDTIQDPQDPLRKCQCSIRHPSRSWILDHVFPVYHRKKTLQEAPKIHTVHQKRLFNPRPAGVWLVTRPAGGGGGAKRSPKLLDRFPNFKRYSIALYVKYPYKVKKFDPEVTDDVTGQVKVRIFDFSGLVTSASKISMLRAKKSMNRHR